MRAASCAAALLLLLTGRAAAEPIEALVAFAVRHGHPVESIIGNQAVVAVPLTGGQICPTVGVLYRDARGRRGPRIDNFQVCPGSEPAVLREVSPAPPDDVQFRQLARMAIRGALRYGSTQVGDWGGYRVETRPLSPVDALGCGQVETVVASMGLLVSYHAGRLCP